MSPNNKARSAEKPDPGAQSSRLTNAGLVEIQIEYRSVGDLVLDARNPRQMGGSHV